MMIFFVLVFCNKNLHECLSYLHTFVLKIWGQSSKNSPSYAILYRMSSATWRLQLFFKSAQGAISCCVKHNDLFVLHLLEPKITWIFFTNTLISIAMEIRAMKMWVLSSKNFSSYVVLHQTTLCCQLATLLFSRQLDAISCAVKHIFFYTYLQLKFLWMFFIPTRISPENLRSI